MNVGNFYKFTVVARWNISASNYLVLDLLRNATHNQRVLVNGTYNANFAVRMQQTTKLE